MNTISDEAATPGMLSVLKRCVSRQTYYEKIYNNKNNEMLEMDNLTNELVVCNNYTLQKYAFFF